MNDAFAHAAKISQLQGRWTATIGAYRGRGLSGKPSGFDVYDMMYAPTKALCIRTVQMEYPKIEIEILGEV